MATKLDPKTVELVEENLTNLAEDINDRWHTVERRDKEARIEIGNMLIEAKKKVDATDLDWDKWCVQNIERSRADIYKVMALARADDPLKALEAERAKRREEMADLRAKRAAAAASDDSTPPVKSAAPAKVSHVGESTGKSATPDVVDELKSKLTPLDAEREALLAEAEELEDLTTTWDEAKPEIKALFRKHIGCTCGPKEEHDSKAARKAELISEPA